MKNIVVAKLLVINEKNELLTLKIGIHTQRPERSHTIDLPGGLVDPGESERAAAVRELEEEASISVNEQDVDLVYTETELSPEKGESVVKLFYRVSLDHTPEVKVSWEHESYAWAPIDRVVETYEFRPYHRRAIEHMVNSL